MNWVLFLRIVRRVRNIRLQKIRISKKLTLLISIIALFIITFFSWHYLFSIYEVKFKYEFNPSELKTNQSYKICAVAINSLGWNLKFRELGLSHKIINGKNIVEISNIPEYNSINFKVLNFGEFILELNSKFSLNATRFKLKAAK